MPNEIDSQLLRDIIVEGRRLVRVVCVGAVAAAAASEMIKDGVNADIFVYFGSATWAIGEAPHFSWVRHFGRFVYPFNPWITARDCECCVLKPGSQCYYLVSPNIYFVKRFRY